MTSPLQKIHHRGEICIDIPFPYDGPNLAKRKVLGAKYSRTKKCRSLNYTPSTYKLLKEPFTDIVIDKVDSVTDQANPVPGPVSTDTLPIGAPMQVKISPQNEPKPTAVIVLTVDKVHKVTNQPLANKLKQKPHAPMGKYLVFGMNHNFLISDDLHNTESVNGNNNPKVVYAFRKTDRYAKLSVKFLTILDQYLDIYKPKHYLLEGSPGSDCPPNNNQNIIKAAVIKAGIKKHTPTHTLRHTFATYSLESGVERRYIQSKVEHNSSKTTYIVTNIRLPQTVLTRLKIPSTT